MINSNPTETRIASIFKDANGIITIKMKNCGKVDELDIIDLNLVLRRKTSKKPSLKLLDTRAIWSMDKKAKERAMQEEEINPTKARAIVVSSILKSAMFTFLRRFNKKEYPQQFFTDKQKAYDWLLSQVYS